MGSWGGGDNVSNHSLEVSWGVLIGIREVRTITNQERNRLPVLFLLETHPGRINPSGWWLRGFARPGHVSWQGG